MQIIEKQRTKLVSERVAHTAHGYTDTLNVFFDTALGKWMPGDSTDVDKLTDARVIEIIDADTYLLGYFGEVNAVGHGLVHGTYYLNDVGYNTQVRPVIGYAQVTMIVSDDDSYFIPAQLAITL